MGKRKVDFSNEQIRVIASVMKVLIRWYVAQEVGKEMLKQQSKKKLKVGRDE